MTERAQFFVRFFGPHDWNGTSHRDWQLSSHTTGVEGAMIVSSDPRLLTAQRLSESSNGWRADDDEEEFGAEHAELADDEAEGWRLIRHVGYLRTGQNTCEHHEDWLAAVLAQKLRHEVIPQLRSLFGIPVVIRRVEKFGETSTVAIITGAEVLEPEWLRYPRFKLNLANGEMIGTFTFAEFKEHAVILWDHDCIDPLKLEAEDKWPVKPAPRYGKEFRGLIIQKAETPVSAGDDLPLAAPTDDQPLSVKINELVSLVQASGGATRVETATEYVFFAEGKVAKVGLPAEVTNSKVIERVVMLVHSLGQTVLTVLSVRLTPLLTNELERPTLPRGYELVGSATEPVILRRYLWPQEWQEQDGLDVVLAEFAQQANWIYTIHCLDYKSTN